MSSINPVRAREFWAESFRLFDLSAAERNNDALTLATQIAERFPELPAEASYLLACAYNRAGYLDQALCALETALERGNCWHDSVLRWSPSLQPLRDLPRFRGILARSKAMMDTLEADTRVGVRVFPPNAHQSATAPPLLLPLHGGADIPGEHDGDWASATDLGVLVGVAQSSQRRSSDTLWWGGLPEPFDEERSKRDVKTAYDEVGATFSFDVTRVVLGGFSQGAVLAVTLALKNKPFPVKGLACVGPSIADVDPLLPLMEPAATRGLRTWILAGERERGLDLITRLAGELTSRGVPCQLDVVPDLGHEFPEDFGMRLRSGLRFLLAS